MSIRPQLWVHPSKPTRKRYAPARNGERGAMMNKPHGGLWTSTWLGEAPWSAWVEWCDGASFGDVPNAHWWLLTPNPDARIVTVDTLRDLHALLAAYPYHPPADSPLARFDGLRFWTRMLDFERLAQDYDGMHLTEHGADTTHLSYPDSLNAWDCESTCWLRWIFDGPNAVHAITNQLAPVKVRSDTEPA